MEPLAVVFTVALGFAVLVLIVKQQRSSAEEPLTLAESIRKKIAKAEEAEKGKRQPPQGNTLADKVREKIERAPTENPEKSDE